MRYSQIIGSLMYLASVTRPDISFVVSKLSWFVSNPGDNHWRALERVMRYMKGTVIRTGYLMLMRFTPQVDMCFCLEVVLFHESQ